MTNILFIEAGSGWGGSSSYLFSLLKYLNRQKFYPIVILYNYEDGPYIKKIKGLGIEVIFLNNARRQTIEPPRSFSASSQKLKKTLGYFRFLRNFIKKDIFAIFRFFIIIKRNNIQLAVLNNDIHYHISAVLATKLAHIPCICRKAGIGGGKKIKKILSRFVDVFIASSNAAAQDHIQNKFPYRKIVTIYEGIDLEKYRPSNNGNKIRREFGIHQDAKVIGTVSRIDTGKGHSYLIKAASLVLKEYPDTIFLIVGDDISSGGILCKQLQQQTNSLGLDGKVIFTGWRRDIPEILAAIDIFVQPSVYPEGLCIAALEAQACGKPTVVTNAGGLAETTVEGTTGFIVPANDALSLSRTILKLLQDKESAEMMGLAAKRRVEEEFDIKKNVETMGSLFEETLNG